MSNMYEEYNRENAMYQRRWAEDAADGLSSQGDYCERFYKAYEEFRHVAFSDPLVEDRGFYDACDKFSSLKKYVLLEWERSVALDVMQIKKYGNDRDKAKLKENMFWIRGIRSVDELFNKIRLDKNGNEIKNEDEKNE
jgi:hypothetical protein